MASKPTDLEHFSRIPWCAPHLAEPGSICVTASSRIPKANKEYELLAKTLNTSDSITAFLTIYKPPSPEQSIQSDKSIRNVKYLISLESGLNGYPGVCHGGIIATILDEIMGLIFTINKDHGCKPDAMCMTGQLNVRFLKPAKVPGTFLCRASVEKVEGRKYFVSGTIEDETGTPVAQGESLYIELKDKL